MSDGSQGYVAHKNRPICVVVYPSFSKGTRTGALLFIFVLAAFALNVILPNKVLETQSKSKKISFTPETSLDSLTFKSNNERIAELIEEEDVSWLHKSDPESEKGILNTDLHNVKVDELSLEQIEQNTSEQKKSIKIGKVSENQNRRYHQEDQSNSILTTNTVEKDIGNDETNYSEPNTETQIEERESTIFNGEEKESIDVHTMKEEGSTKNHSREITSAYPTETQEIKPKQSTAPKSTLQESSTALESSIESGVLGKHFNEQEENTTSEATPIQNYSKSQNQSPRTTIDDQKKKMQDIEERITSDALHLYEDEEGHIAGCAIPNSCVSFSFSGDPRIHLLSKYRSIEEAIRKCVLDDHMQLIFEDESQLGYRSKYSQNVDVIGFPILIDWFSHFAHFSNMYEKFMASAMGIFYPGGPKIKRPRCINPLDINDESEECAEETLYPEVVLSSRAMGPKTRRTWIAQLFKELQNATGNKENLILPELPTNGSKICFRHLCTSRRRYYTEDKSLDWPLRKTGITREQIEIEGVCKPHIVIIFRPYYIGRSFESSVIAGLVKEIERQTQHRNESVPTFETIVDIGKYSLKEQMEIMQRADVIISGHGAELSNALFLRPNSTVIEVCPFLYHCEYFNGILSAANAEHVVETSLPDRETFEQCMIQTSKNNVGNKTDIEYTMESFRQRASKFEELTTREEREAVSNPETLSFEAQVCVRSQKLIVDPKSLVELAMEKAMSKCKVRIK